MRRRQALLALAGAWAAPARGAVGPGRNVWDFVESVGLNVHLSSPPYVSRFRQVLELTAALGVRHLRDELRPDDDLGRWRALHAQAGVRSHLLVSPATNTPGEMLDVLNALGTARVAAVEGQNEGDSSWFQAHAAARGRWADTVTAYQRAIFRALQARFGAERPAVLSPSVLDYRPGDMRRIAGAAGFCDAVALHAYAQGGQEPETRDPFAGLDWYLRTFCQPFKPGAPVMVTETGYHAGQGGLSERARAIYLPRSLLHAWSAGVARTFLYELMDGGENAADPEQNYGLVTSAGERKESFETLRMLLGALRDSEPGFEPAPLAPNPAPSLPGARAVSFRKRGGEAVLALWLPARVWDPAGARDLAPPTLPMRLALPRRFGTVSRLRLETGEDWRTMPAGDVLELGVSGVVTLVRLEP